MKRIFILILTLFFSVCAQDKDELDELVKKRLIGGTADTPITKNYDKEQLTKFNQRLKILVKNAKSGDTNAMVNIGNLHYLGTGHKIFSQNLPVAVKWFQKASDLGNAEAMHNLAICYLHGAGVENDEAKAIDYLKKAVNNGLFEISHKLATLLEDKKDFIEARKYYKIAVNRQRDIKSLKKLADYYMNGIGGEKNEKDAFQFYLRTAKSGDADSQFVLAKTYSLGTFVEKDEKEVSSWLQLAASNANAEAQLQLGLFYFEGKGEYVKNRHVAISWIKKSAKQGNEKAQLVLGEIYDGLGGEEADPKEAYKWYRLVAFRDNPAAMLKLGLFYEYGRGVKADESVALQWYEKSVALKYAPAVMRLGHVYEQGIIVNKDTTKALTYFEEANRLKYGEASVYLAKIYYEGQLVKQDKLKAFEILKQAALDGYTPAIDVLKNYN